MARPPARWSNPTGPSRRRRGRGRTPATASGSRSPWSDCSSWSPTGRERTDSFHYTRTEQFVPLYAWAVDDAATAGLSGRRAEAGRNDERILEAAREVFVANPGAPIASVAARAGVGISALYRRYPSKEDLLRQLNREGLQRYIATAEAAVADDGDPWLAFATFMRGIVEADTHSLTQRLAGTFTPTEDLYALANRAQELNVQLFERTRSSGAIRPDVVVDDIALLFEQLAAIRVGD